MMYCQGKDIIIKYLFCSKFSQKNNSSMLPLIGHMWECAGHVWIIRLYIQNTEYYHVTTWQGIIHINKQEKAAISGREKVLFSNRQKEF